MIRLHNTLTGKLEEFKPIKEMQVGIYSCGPTVYWNQHIGHMYAYVHWDVLVRFLRFAGFKVKWVMNITDVGHMTSDEDAGQDKMEKGAIREGLTVWQIADKYLKQFKESLKILNISEPDELPRATEHISEQVELAKKIEANGYAYKTKTGLVFDTAKFGGYKDFAGLKLEKQDAGSRVEVDPEKKNPWDFLLWVINQPKHIMQWDSPWGRGFPGWHLECTAMSTKYLGEQFDIHTGGKEHIAVHHTNEIAQGVGAFGRQTANFWLHNAWLKSEGGQKMSKSLGNFLTVQDLQAKGYQPLALRYLFLTSHYRKGLNFSFKALEGAQIALKRLEAMAREWGDSQRVALSEEKLAQIDVFRQRFIEALSDDLNVAEAMAVVWQMAKSNIPGMDKLELLEDFDRVLGLGLIGTKAGTREVPEAVVQLAETREKLRREKKWAEADKVRLEIEKQGWQLEDSPAGSRLLDKHG